MVYYVNGTFMHIYNLVEKYKYKNAWYYVYDLEYVNFSRMDSCKFTNNIETTMLYAININGIILDRFYYNILNAIYT